MFRGEALQVIELFENTPTHTALVNATGNSRIGISEPGFTRVEVYFNMYHCLRKLTSVELAGSQITKHSLNISNFK